VFLPVVEIELTQMRIQLAARSKYYSVFLQRKMFPRLERVTRQETTFTRTLSRNKRLHTKTPEKEHISMVSQPECESCFQANVLIFTFIFRCSG